MRDVAEAFQLAGDILGVEQVDGDVRVARCGLGQPARQADDLPVAFGQKLVDDVAPDDAERAHDHGFLRRRLHAALATVPCASSVSISASAKPCAARTSVVCWPVAGAVPRGVPSAWGSMPGKAGTGTAWLSPAWVSHWIRPVSRTCGWSKNSAELFRGSVVRSARVSRLC